MPRIVPQIAKAPSTIHAQPRQLNTRINDILLLDLAGATTNEIAEKLDYEVSRVSLIKTSPLYMQRITEERALLASRVIEKKSDKIVTDTVQARLKGLASRAVDEYENLLEDGKSEVVRKTVADEILDRAGYKAAGEKTSVVVQLTEKMADRFERVMGLPDGHSKPERGTTISIKKEMSS